jgi:hypothetical protein
MTLRSALAAKIPRLYQVTFVNDAEVLAVRNNGPLHRFLATADAAWGVWGGPEPYTTISSRTAHRLLESQHDLAGAPLWALLLGAALETVDPGHLQGAMIADVSRQVAGIFYLTGIRVLSPPLKV